MTITIKPSVGRIVWYHPNRREEGGFLSQPQAAIITYVHGDDLVNLSVFTALGYSVSRCQVYLAPPNTAISQQTASAGYASWMPWQIEQAEKAQAARIAEWPNNKLPGMDAFSKASDKLLRTALELNFGVHKGRFRDGKEERPYTGGDKGQVNPQPTPNKKTATEQLDELDAFFQKTFGGTKPTGAADTAHREKGEDLINKALDGELKPKEVVVFFL